MRDLGISQGHECRRPGAARGGSGRALQNSGIPYPGIFLDSNQGVSRKVGEFVGAAGSNAGGVRKRIRDSSDKAAQHLAHALGESVAGGNPGLCDNRRRHVISK